MSNVGDMLRLARQRLGFGQQTAAARLGIAQPLLSRLENGVSTPDDAFLDNACRAYEVPRSFFDIRDPVYGPPVSVHAMLRGRADVTSRELDMITAELNVRVMHLRCFLDNVDFHPINDLPSLDVEQFGSPERIAATVRAHWGVPSGPIKNLTALVERAGIVVGLSAFGGAPVSGVTFRVPGRPPVILLNGAHPADRLRFTLAHELGHLVMHRMPTATMEEEANEFASSLLMPSADISSAFQGRRITLALLAALKPEWKVAMQALLMRARSLGFVRPNQERYLWQQISARGWRLHEPPELNFEPEKPGVLNTIVRSHLSDLGYSFEELLNLLRIYEQDFSKLYDKPSDSGPVKPKLRIVTGD